MPIFKMTASIEMYFMSCFLLIFPYATVLGSSIHFNSSPDDLHANLTSTLTLTCEVNDTAVTSSSSPSSSTLIGRRDVTQTSDNLAFLTSLVIVKNGKEHLATVTEHTAATAFGGGSGNIEVKGHITGSSGFLQISWSRPTAAQVGEYVCEANAVTSQSHGVQLSRSLAVEISTPGISDLVTYIHGLQVKAEVQEKTNLELKTEIQTLKTAVVQARHVESGTISCGPQQTSWTGKMAPLQTASPQVMDDVITKSQSFSSVYDKPPVVHLSVEYILANVQLDPYLYRSVELVQVDEGKFTMRCRSNLSKRVLALTVSWISVPQ